jgi:uncharacterized protein (TIGR02996 family)
VAKKKLNPHERAFLDAIGENPEDDGPRLVYADWLDDHGQPHRAELIRLQCRLALLEEHDPERLRLEQREADLLFAFGKGWSAVPPCAGDHLRSFHRGFFDRLSTTASDFLKRGGSFFAASPLTEVQLRNVRGRAPRLAASPLLGRLTTLCLYDSDLTPDDLHALGASPHLGNLRALALSRPVLNAEHAQALAGWSALPRLRRLQFSARTNHALEALAGVPGRLAALRSLQIGGAAGAAAFRALREAAPELEHLHVLGTDVAPEHLEALAAQPALRSLHIYNCGADGLADAELTGKLSSLRLSSVLLSSRALSSLARGPRLASLRRLSVGYVDLGPEAGRFLATAPLGALVRLDLDAVRLDADAARALASSPRLAGLRWLSLSGNALLGDDGARAVASSPHLGGLIYLDLGGCGVGPAGAVALAASPNLARLLALRLRQNPLGDEGVAALAGSPHLAGLHTLELSDVRAGEAGVRALARARGLGGLRRLDLGSNLPAAHSRNEFADPSRLPRLLWLAVDGHRDGTALAALGRPIEL